MARLLAIVMAGVFLALELIYIALISWSAFYGHTLLTTGGSIWATIFLLAMSALGVYYFFQNLHGLIYKKANILEPSSHGAVGLRGFSFFLAIASLEIAASFFGLRDEGPIFLFLIISILAFLALLIVIQALNRLVVAEIEKQHNQFPGISPNS